MYCSSCGERVSDGALFCPECGAPQTPAQEAAATPPPRDRAVIHTAPPEDRYVPEMEPVPPRRGSSQSIWIVLACVGIVVIALAIALPLLLLRGGEGNAGVTTTSSLLTTSTSEPVTTSTETPTTSTEPTTDTTEASTTTTAKPLAQIPGDSAGAWTELTISGLDLTVNEVALSEDALLFQAGANGLYAYMFASGETIGLPTSSAKVGGIDIYGDLVVWAESNGSDPVTDAHIYAQLLPNGPKVEIASGTSVAYPQVTAGMVTWVEGQPWATQPDEWYDYTIKGVAVNKKGQPAGSASVLVGPGHAVAATTGDATWTYSLSDGFLAWEQQTKAGAIKVGTWAMDLGEMSPWRIAADAWRPSLYKNHVAYTQNGVDYAKFGGKGTTIDGAGDFATAAPTYAAYFRPKPSGSGTAWQIVAKGHTGAYEQVLLDDAGTPPWFLPSIAASSNRVAFTVDGQVHLFTWKE